MKSMNHRVKTLSLLAFIRPSFPLCGNRIAPILVALLPIAVSFVPGPHRIATLLAASVDADADKPRILVGPNMLVTRDGDIPHVELSIDANPKNPKNLLGAAITATRSEGGWACKTYATHNGGDSWMDAVLPEQHIFGGGDPQVAFGIQGTAYFSALADTKDEEGNAKAAVLFYRSEDGGVTWQKPTNLGASYDHDVIAVDHTSGRFAGRIYISVLYGYPTYRLGVFRSDDDGRTFIGPVEAANGGGKIGINTAANILVLSDGTLIIPYVDFEFLPEKRKESHTGNFWIVSSSDGAVTFSAPKKMGTQESEKSPDAPMIMTFPSFAADSHSVVFKDRLYAAWTDLRNKQYRVWFSFSIDRGTSWSEPKQVDATVPESSWQYQPMLAVNSDGIFAVTWFDTRDSQNHTMYDEYFTASLDGGNSFLTPVRVSSEHSTYPGDGNFAMYPSAWNYKNELRLTFLSAASRWGVGGDYMGLTADSWGNFHPFWADNRTGTSMIETATIQVRSAKPTRDEGKPIEPTAPPTLTKTDVTGRIALVFDPTRFNATTGDLEMPVRIKNISDQAVYGPIVATIRSFGSGEGEEDREYSPQILNASSGGSGAGAAFDFTPALGDSGQLPSGGVSGSLVWRLRLSKPLRTPDVHVTFSGRVPETK